MSWRTFRENLAGRLQPHDNLEAARAIAQWTATTSGPKSDADYEREPATAIEALQDLLTKGSSGAAIRSYLAPGPQPRYDTPQARDEARTAEQEAGQ